MRRIQIQTACTAETHHALSHGSCEAWLDGTIPLHTGDRPICSGGLMYSDCLACYQATGARYTICRRVRCTLCGAPVDGLDYCSPTCEAADATNEDERR